MSCDRPTGLGVMLLRDQNIQFPPNWAEALPPCETAEALREMVLSSPKASGLSEQQVDEACRFFLDYEARYFEAPGGQCYHRPCNGGAVVAGELGIYCSNCGKLPDLPPPSFLR